MASAFSHIAVPIALSLASGSHRIPFRLLLLGLFLSIAPDLDSIGLQLGVPYESPWGHRGFTHSLFFALVVAFALTAFKNFFNTGRLIIFVTAFISMISHGVLDAFTNGGLGVAFFWPLNQERYFFPWKVIEVSPLSVGRFFSEWGLVVLRSEIYYVWIPCLTLGILLFALRKFYLKN